MTARALAATLAAAALMAALAASTLAAPAHGAAAEGRVAIEPRTGRSDQGDIRLITERPCPATATNVVVQAIGGPFPPDSNALGNSELAGLPAPVIGDGLTLALFGSWDVIAQANGAGPLSGVVELVVVCFRQGFAERLAEMRGQVRFTSVGDRLARYEQVGGPQLYSGLSSAPGTERGQQLARAANSRPPSGRTPGTPPAAASAGSGTAPVLGPGPGPAPQGSGPADSAPDPTVAAASRESRGGPGFVLLLLGALLSGAVFLAVRTRRLLR
ncbi:MAG: hypothetical protein ACT4PP_16415 [Sporichthyaceae bacterium]